MYFALNSVVKILKYKPYLYVGLFLARMAIYIWQRRKEHIQMHTKKFGNGTRDIVDEASWQSFPASDPPASNVFK